MQFKSLTPLLWTENLEETIQFYEKYLKFSCKEKNTDWGWACLQKDSIEIMLSLPNVHTPYTSINFTGSFYFQVDNVEDLWEKLQKKVTIVYPLEDFDWNMREFAIYDNNGYILQFGQTIQ